MELTKKHKEWWDTFIPRSLSGLILWLDDPAIASNIIEDGSNRVSKWNDISGNNNHFIQNTGADQPLRSGSEIIFDGVSEFLDGSGNIANFASNTEGTIIYIYENLSGIGFVSGVGIIGSNNNRQILFDIGTGLKIDFLNRIGAPTQNRFNGTANVGSGKVIISIRGDTTQYLFNINNAVDTPALIVGNNDGRWYNGLTGLNQFVIGAATGASLSFGNILLSSYIEYNRGLSDAELTLVTNYLNNRLPVF